MNKQLELLKQLEETFKSESPNYKHETAQLLKAVPESLIDLFEEGEESFYIAGGAITSIFSKQPINDVDIYPKTTFAKLKLINYMKSSTGIQTITPKSIYGVCNGGFHINLVLLENVTSAKDIFEKFDFSINMGAYDMNSGSFYFDLNFFRDLAARYIRINQNTLYPLVSVMRTSKYEQRGYTVGKNELAKLLLKASSLKIESIEDVEAHLGGMYGIDFSELINDQDFSIDLVCDKLSDIQVDYEEYFRLKRDKFDDQIKKLIISVINQLVEEGFFNNVYKYNSVLFIKQNNIYDVFDFDFDIPKEVNIPEIPQDATIYLYKNVLNKDDKYYSYYRKTFEYKLNEEIVPEGKDYLYFYSFKDVIKGTYSKEKDKHVLKAKVYIKDIATFGGVITVKKCIPVDVKCGELFDKSEDALPF